MSRYNEINVGDVAEIIHIITQSDIDKFVDLTGDDNKLHIDRNYASKTSFKKPVAHGMLSASFISTIIGTKLPGDGALWYSQNLEFLLPVRIGDEITVRAKVLKKIDTTQSLELSTEIFNQNRQKVISGSALVQVVDTEIEKTIVENHNEYSKTALIVGATGGIGSAVAKKMAEHGYDVILHFFNNENKAISLKNELEIKYNISAAIFKANLLIERDVKNLIDFVKRKFESLSVFINAATVTVPNIKISDLEWRDFQDHLDINIKSNFLLLKSLIPIMEKQKYGKVVMITTLATEQPNAEWLHYITAKSALNGFVKAMAIEIAKFGIRINLVSPGMTDTDLIANIPQKARLLNAAKTPLKKLASVDDVANAVLYLSLSSSDFLTGETIRVNGGQVMI